MAGYELVHIYYHDVSKTVISINYLRFPVENGPPDIVIEKRVSPVLQGDALGAFYDLLKREGFEFLTNTDGYYGDISVFTRDIKESNRQFVLPEKL